MNIEIFFQSPSTKAISELYGCEIAESMIQFSKTRKEFEGDVTLVVFSLLKISRKAAEATATEIGEKLMTIFPQIENFNVVKGFLNLKLKESFWIERFNEIEANEKFGFKAPRGTNLMVEYSSPNTNKPLHLGHVRNNLLGYAVARIAEANGYNVTKVNLVNDRGIHICKSMLAWQKFANQETPQSSNLKGDHLVGKYYVAFDKAYKAEIKELTDKGMSEEEAKKNAPIILEASEMLRKWEAKDPEVYSLWETMNGWVYEGFEKTYKAMGVSFDKIYHESETYILGKSLVEDGLSRGVFYRENDGSVWINLEEDGLDKKLLLRGDGTSVYMTQDLGTAFERHKEFNFDNMIYVVGNEQNYHFQVLKLILKKLGYNWADAIYHLSYGMVELPNGKMKSREGTVVDADDLIEEMVKTATDMSNELGKLDAYSKEEAAEICRKIGLGALKYFILKVDPRKTMLFDPKESIDFNGNTGPFVQYTSARISSVLRKASDTGINYTGAMKSDSTLNKKEIEIIKLINDFELAIENAGDNFAPSVIASYCYDLAKEFNQLYHDYSFLKEECEAIKQNRLRLANEVRKTLERGMGLLGIEMPERM